MAEVADLKDFICRKFCENVERDKKKAAELRRLGWRVLTIWECETCSPARLQRLAERLMS